MCCVCKSRTMARPRWPHDGTQFTDEVTLLRSRPEGGDTGTQDTGKVERNVEQVQLSNTGRVEQQKTGSEVVDGRVRHDLVYSMSKHLLN